MSKKYIPTVLFSIVCAIGIVSPVYANSIETGPALVCLDKKELNNKMTPVDLYLSFTACVMSERLEPAMLAYLMAGSFGTFDALRVNDATARQVPKVLLNLSFNSLPEDRIAKFQEYGKKLSTNASVLKKYCTDFKRMKPPSYYPEYMIQHGMAAFSSENKPPLRTPFNAQAAWTQAVNIYLQCE